MKLRYSLIATLGTALCLSACAQPGVQDEANVYQADQVNQAQNAKIITILSLSPARVEVSNAQNQKEAQIAGGLLGAIGGGLLGGELGTVGTGLGGAALGGVGGAAAGSLVNGKTIVPGVTIGYTENGQLRTSTEVGQMCQFKLGQALVVSTSPTETRVQPNAECPVKN